MAPRATLVRAGDEAVRALWHYVTCHDCRYAMEVKAMKRSVQREERRRFNREQRQMDRHRAHRELHDRHGRTWPAWPPVALQVGATLGGIALFTGILALFAWVQG